MDNPDELHQFDLLSEADQIRVTKMNPNFLEKGADYQMKYEALCDNPTLLYTKLRVSFFLHSFLIQFDNNWIHVILAIKI